MDNPSEYVEKGTECPECDDPAPTMNLGPTDDGEATLYVCARCGTEFGETTDE